MRPPGAAAGGLTGLLISPRQGCGLCGRSQAIVQDRCRAWGWIWGILQRHPLPWGLSPTRQVSMPVQCAVHTGALPVRSMHLPCRPSRASVLGAQAGRWGLAGSVRQRVPVGTPTVRWHEPVHSYSEVATAAACHEASCVTLASGPAQCCFAEHARLCTCHAAEPSRLAFR